MCIDNMVICFFIAAHVMSNAVVLDDVTRLVACSYGVANGKKPTGGEENSS